MASQPALPPDENVDFICGRGGNHNNKKGNQLELKDVKSALPEYLQSPAKHKRPVVKKVIEAVKHRGGRFLKKVKTRKGITIYIDITGNRECFQKVGQQFRDMREKEQQRENGSLLAANVVVQPNPDEQSTMAMDPGAGAEPVEPPQQPFPVGNQGAPEDEDISALDHESLQMDPESLELESQIHDFAPEDDDNSALEYESLQMDPESLEPESQIHDFATQIHDFASHANHLFESYMLTNPEGSPDYNMAKLMQEHLHRLMQLEAAAQQNDLAFLDTLPGADSGDNIFFVSDLDQVEFHGAEEDSYRDVQIGVGHQKHFLNFSNSEPLYEAMAITLPNEMNRRQDWENDLESLSESVLAVLETL